MSTLVIDTGQDIVGIYLVEGQGYIPDRYIYYRGTAISTAIYRIECADEVVTYSGNDRDWPDLEIFATGLGQAPFAPKGEHTDMRSICWSDRIWGSDLRSTYFKHFDECPHFENTHEGSNECDVYMTFKLWDLSKRGKLKVLGGNYI